MLILKIDDEREKVKKVKGIFRKKIIYEKTEEIKRYSIDINGKTVTVLELPRGRMENEDVLSLLKIYKGRVLVSKENYHNKILNDYLFDPREYYQRAVLSSLKNQIRTVNKEWKNICIKIDNFSPFKEFFDIVKVTKALTLITPKNPITAKFLNDCYYDFGAIVSVKSECTAENDVYLDLEQIDGSGKLMINVKGKSFLLYPDSRYFAVNKEFQKLQSFNIEHSIICAAFSD